MTSIPYCGKLAFTIVENYAKTLKGVVKGVLKGLVHS